MVIRPRTLEDRRRELAWRQADEGDRALAPHHVNRLSERCRRYRRHQSTMDPTAGFLDDLCGRIRLHCVYRHIGTRRAG